MRITHIMHSKPVLYRRAFTLIELLVVISIIAILAAILFPVFAQAKLAAKKTADLSNIKQIGTAVVMYVTDSDDEYPLATYFPSGAPYGDFYRWSSQLCLGPYIKNTDIFRAPIDNYTPDLTTYTFEDPIPNTRKAAAISYITNSLTTTYLASGGVCKYFPQVPAAVTDCTGAINPGGWYVNNPTPVSDTSADSPSDLIIFSEGSVELSNWWGCPNTVNTETFACYGSDLVYGWDALNMALGTSFGSPDVNMAKAWRPYANQSNFSFGDTHAKTLPAGKLTIGPLLNPRYWLVHIPAGY